MSIKKAYSPQLINIMPTLNQVINLFIANAILWFLLFLLYKSARKKLKEEIKKELKEELKNERN